MKQFFLSLLTCGICFSAFAQIDTSKKIKPGNSEKWEIKAFGTEPGKGKGGRLQVNFLADSIYDTQKNEFVPGKIKISRSGQPDVLLTSDKFSADGHPLPAGIYQVTLNNVLVANVPIEGNKKTRLKTGLLKINSEFDTTRLENGDMVSRLSVVEKATWYIHDKNKPYNQYHISSKGSCSLTIPIGNYGIRIWGSYPVNEISIKDKNTVNLEVPLALVSIIVQPPIHWVLKDGDPSNTITYFASDDNQTFLGLPLGKYILYYGQFYNSKAIEITGCTKVSIPDQSNCYYRRCNFQ